MKNFNTNELIAENFDQGDPIFKVVEEMPRFPGCEEENRTVKEKDECAKGKLLEFVYENLTYPTDARNAEIEGMCVLQFIIEKDGKISNAKIVRDIGEGCGAESLKVVNSMPTWTPGKQNGKAVRVQYTFPVKFKLESKELSAEEKNRSSKVESEEVLEVVEEMPRFPGCEDSEMSLSERDDCAKKKMMEFIYTNIKYPTEAKHKGIEGTAVVQLIIEKDGSVSSSVIIRDPGAGIGAESKRVVDLMPKWTVGKQRGKAVRVQLVLPVKYMLDGKKDKSKEIEKTKNKVDQEVDQIPLFPGTSSKEESVNTLLDFVFKNVKYPEEAMQNSIEGLALIKFIINTEGEIQKVRLTKSPGWGIDENVLKMMEKMKKIDAPWTPAIMEKQNVNYEYLLPVKFKLQDHQIEKAKSRQLDVQQLQISPNPSNGIFTLNFTLLNKSPADIVFYSVEGKVLKSFKNVNVPFTNAIDLTTHRGQTIFMNIIQKDRIHSDKIIVQ